MLYEIGFTQTKIQEQEPVRHGSRSVPRQQSIQHYCAVSQRRLDMVSLRTLLSLVLVASLIAVPAVAQQKPKIEGVWRMISGKEDGKERLTPSTADVKYITAKHWIFIYQDKAKTTAALAKKSQGDPLKAYQDSFGAGAGTYKLVGNTYTETIEQFVWPEYIGLSLDYTIRVEGNRLYQSGKFPYFENGKKVKEVLLEEVYERLE
jgi:hypothetical protein